MRLRGLLDYCFCWLVGWWLGLLASTKLRRRSDPPLTVGQSHICVSGIQAVHGKDDNGVDTTYWPFDKFKTKLGCNGYFGLCDSKFQTEKAVNWSRDEAKIEI